MAGRKVLRLVLPPREDRKSALEVLKEAARQVRAGEISSVCVAYVRPDMTVGAAFSEGLIGPMLGAVHLLSKRLCDATDQD